MPQPQDVPADLRAFIAEHIGSIVQLELLLLLAAEAEKFWTADEAAKKLYVSPEAVRGFLEGMRVRGLCELAAEGAAPANSYRFAPKKEESRGVVAALAEFYKERRLTVTDLIYAGPTARYQSFADAFRFKRDQ